MKKLAKNSESIKAEPQHREGCRKRKYLNPDKIGRTYRCLPRFQTLENRSLVGIKRLTKNELVRFRIIVVVDASLQFGEGYPFLLDVIYVSVPWLAIADTVDIILKFCPISLSQELGSHPQEFVVTSSSFSFVTNARQIDPGLLSNRMEKNFEKVMIKKNLTWKKLEYFLRSSLVSLQNIQ